MQIYSATTRCANSHSTIQIVLVAILRGACTSLGTILYSTIYAAASTVIMQHSIRVLKNCSVWLADVLSYRQQPSKTAAVPFNAGLQVDVRSEGDAVEFWNGRTHAHLAIVLKIPVSKPTWVAGLSSRSDPTVGRVGNEANEQVRPTADN